MQAAGNATRVQNECSTGRGHSEAGPGLPASPSLACWALVLALCGCEDEAAPTAAPVLPSLPPALSAPASEAAPVPSVPLSPELQRRLKVDPPSARPARLAFGAGGIGQLQREALVVRSLDGEAKSKRYPVLEPRQLLTLRGGDLLALTNEGSLRVAEGRKPESLPRASLFPRAWVYPDLVSPDRFWVLQGDDDALFGQQLAPGAGSLLRLAGHTNLPGFDGRALGAVASGAFLYTTPEGLALTYPIGKAMPLAFEASDAWRILPARRPDRAWLVTASGSITVLELHPAQGKARARAKFDVGQGLYDASSDDQLLALLFLEQPDEAPWHLRVEVYDASGARAWRQSLPPLEIGGDDWASELAHRAEIAVDRASDCVAVGGADALTFFRLSDGSRR